MKKYLGLILLLALAACQSNNSYTISGTLPGNQYDGEYIFLTPLGNAPREKVDSLTISNGKFCFTGKTNTTEMYVIRVRPALRVKLQDLLIVKEQGNIIAKIGQPSFGGGTPLNDSLQSWKEQKMILDSLYFDLYEQYRKASEPDKTALKQKGDSLYSQIVDFNLGFIQRNKGNVVGEFVERMTGNPKQHKSNP
jgi:hypothetical protein